MELVTASLILCATLMTLWGATMLVLMTGDRPLVSVIVQTVNPPAKVVLLQRAQYVFS